MANKVRNTSGKFAPKSEVPRKVRSVNLTDTAWQWLADVAAQAGVSRNDYLEALADGAIPLIETVSTDKIETTEQPESNVSPLMEMVSHALTTPEEALAHAAIFGFTPEEALADAHFQIAMLESNYDGLEDRHEVAKRELAELRSQLIAEKARWADLEEELQARDKTCANLQGQLADLKQNSAPARELPDAADLLNQLKAKRKKSSATLADVEKILEILEGDDEH